MFNVRQFYILNENHPLHPLFTQNTVLQYFAGRLVRCSNYIIGYPMVSFSLNPCVFRRLVVAKTLGANLAPKL